MIGIYKITNLLDGRCYIGQTNDIERRFYEHKTTGWKSGIPLDGDIKELGVENFSFEIIEECSIEQLDEKEMYWNAYYKSYPDGYNRNPGGNQQSIGEHNGRAKLTQKEVESIRIAYNNHARQKEVYESFKDKLTWNSFQNLWQGRSWAHVMPEVFTEENKQYYKTQQSIGSNSSSAKFTDEEVIHLRQRYLDETAKEIWEDYKDRVSLDALQKILWGHTYKNLPVWGKREKEPFTDEEIMTMRKRYEKESAPKIWEDYKDRVPLSSLKKILQGYTYTHLPYYKKSQKKWIS